MKSVILTENQFRMINESYGIFDGCEELAVRILNVIYDHRDEDWKRLIIDRVWFSPTKALEIRKTDENVRAGYVYTWYKIRGLENPTICVNPLIIDWKAESSLIGTFMHELTHAYEDCMRIRKGGSMFQVAQKIGYDKNFKCFTNKNVSDELKEISRMLYTLTPFEINALFAGMYAKLSNFNGYEIETPKEALGILRFTVEYKKIMNCILTAEEIMETQDNTSRKLKVYYVNLISDYKFTSFEQLCKWLQHKITKLRKKLSENLPKMVMGYFNKNEQP